MSSEQREKVVRESINEFVLDIIEFNSFLKYIIVYFKFHFR